MQLVECGPAIQRQCRWDGPTGPDDQGKAKFRFSHAVVLPSEAGSKSITDDRGDGNGNAEANADPEIRQTADACREVVLIREDRGKRGQQDGLTGTTWSANSITGPLFLTIGDQATRVGCLTM